MLFIAAIATLVLPDPGGQTPVDPVCTAQPSACRVVSPFDLRWGDQVFPMAPAGLRPWVQDGRLTIFPGESVVLTVAPDGAIAVESVARAVDVLKDDVLDKLAGVFGPGGEGENATEREVVPGPSAPAMAAPLTDRLRITFRQSAHDDEMMLVIQSGFDAPVTYNAGMLTPRQGTQVWSATSVCTVMVDVLGFEHWPHPIIALSLGEFRVNKGAPPRSYTCA